MDVEPIPIEIVSCFERLYGSLKNYDARLGKSEWPVAASRANASPTEWLKALGWGLLSEHKVPFPRSSVKPLSANQSE